MNRFDVHALAHVLHAIRQAETDCIMLKGTRHGSPKPDRPLLERATKSMEMAEAFFCVHNLTACLKDTETAKEQWQRPLLDVSSACEILHHLQVDIVSDLESKMFLKIEDDRGELVGKDALFGEQVNRAFKSAVRDIKESGNCLAAECNTATVFHLMRASEVALRAIAMDRRVTFANKPLDQQEWGTILGTLEGKLQGMRFDDGKKWKTASFKEAQIGFYNDVVQELRGFNGVWRRHLCHADPQAFYDRDAAAGIMKHVRTFMQKLSIRIGENTTMPQYWESE